MDEEFIGQVDGQEIKPVVDGRFEIKSVLGEGGMGIVYEAFHRDMARTVALKVLKSTTASLEQQVRFRQEAQVICKLEHPNIVSIYSFGLDESGSPYIAMELLDGKPLTELMKESGGLPWQSAVRLFLQACNALEHAHKKGIIHRDIKPSNLIVVGDPSSDAAQLKVVDFGIAKVLGSDSITRTNVIVGSVFYLSPGQCEGRAPDVQSDIYALGCSLFEALAGRPPFVGDFYLETMVKHRHQAAPRVQDVRADADLPDHLEQVIACCLRKDSAHRYAHTAALREDLERVLAGAAPQNIPQIDSSSERLKETSAKDPLAQRVSWRNSLRAIGITAVLGLGVCALLSTTVNDRSHTAVSSDVERSQLLAKLDQDQFQVSALFHKQDPEAYREAARVLLSASKTAQELGSPSQEAQFMESSSFAWCHLIDSGLRTRQLPSAVRNETLTRVLEVSTLSSFDHVGEFAGKPSSTFDKRLHENCLNTAVHLAVGYYQLNNAKAASRLAERTLQELAFLDVVRDREDCQHYQSAMQELVSSAFAHGQPALGVRLLKERVKWMKRAHWAAADLRDELVKYEEQCRQLGRPEVVEEIRALIREIK